MRHAAMTAVVEVRRRRIVMRRIAIFLSVVAVTLLGLVGIGAQSRVIAQEATPGAEEMMPAGVTFEPVAYAPGVDVPSPADLLLARFSVEPGSSLPLLESDPTGGLLLVESGTFTVTVEKEITISRGAGMSAAMATAEAGGEPAAPQEIVAAGEEFTLAEGDAAWIPGSVNGEIRNDGDSSASGLVFLVSPQGGMMMEATPES
jgi:hypothetical protein